MSLVEVYDHKGNSQSQIWKSHPDYKCELPNVDAAKFREVSALLLERPNLNSSHLFRADILYDSLGRLKTVLEKERALDVKGSQPLSKTSQQGNGDTIDQAIVDAKVGDGIDINITMNGAPIFDGFQLEQTVIRKLIPRNPQLYSALKQSCFTYSDASTIETCKGHWSKHLMVYVPRVTSEEEMPSYHPRIQALAYLFEDGSECDEASPSMLSIHYKPLDTPYTANENKVEEEAQSTRLHRTFLSLLRTFIRLTKLEKPSYAVPKATSDSIAESKVSSRSTAPSALKDTILPQHAVQDTYARLKQIYAAELMSRWVEKTEPSKHVFEDLSIAAFLIELWKQMYDNKPFPGFVDFACGNGILVYVLIREGYRGYGYDARRRKTWGVLGIDEYLEEKLCIPEPFLPHLEDCLESLSLIVHNGMFAPDTFIISNHADELTPWTPILATLSNMTNPLPFLAIPCCSHSLSGARHRYSVKEIDSETVAFTSTQSSSNEKEQDSRGDLRALRAKKLQATKNGNEESQYACLTKKVVALAEEAGNDVEMTMLRIPSTRNIGIVGNRKRVMLGSTTESSSHTDVTRSGVSPDKEVVQAMLERECQREGGIGPAAQIWYDRTRKLRETGSRGKLNLGRKPEPSSSTTTMNTVEKDQVLRSFSVSGNILDG